MALRPHCQLLVLLTVVICGCNSGESLPTVPVTGTVTLKGQPVEGATVTFSSKSQETGRAATGTTDAAGKYTLKTYLSATSSPSGALPGEYTVTVTKLEVKTASMTPDEMAKKMATNKTGSVMSPPKNLLPERYAGAKSGLTATVKAEGPNDIPFDLQE